VGGTFHGFAAYQSAALHKTLWDVTIGLIGASAAFMVAAALSSPWKRHSAKAWWLRAGLWITVAGLAIQQTGLAIHPSFNHNDLFHCLQTVALYFLYRGARLQA
jgi:hypothetical protein